MIGKATFVHLSKLKVMEKEFVTYEQALALKELGFDEPCIGRYYSQNKNLPIFMQWTKAECFNSKLIDGAYITDEKISPFISAPLYQQAFRWFREKHNLRVSFPYWNGYNQMIHENRRYTYECIIIPESAMGISVRCEEKDTTIFKVYEEAESACLDKLIEIVKNYEI